MTTLWKHCSTTPSGCKHMRHGEGSATMHECSGAERASTRMSETQHQGCGRYLWRRQGERMGNSILLPTASSLEEAQRKLSLLALPKLNRRAQGGDVFRRAPPIRL
jgi:hypothetical protein